MANEEVVATPEVTPIVPAVPPEVPPVAADVKVETKTYTQEDLDRIVNKVKKNARYQTKKEIEAYYQGRDSRPEPKEAPASSREVKPPERANFDSYEEFLEAKAAFSGSHAAEERIKAREQESADKRTTETRNKTLTEFQKKVSEKYPDIEERLENIADIVIHAGALEAIADSDVGPDILNHLADNPKECERIASLSPIAAIREIGRIEAKLEAKPEPKKTASKAPAPITPGGGGSPSDDTPKDTDTIDEWMRKERARERKQAGA